MGTSRTTGRYWRAHLNSTFLKNWTVQDLHKLIKHLHSCSRSRQTSRNRAFSKSITMSWEEKSLRERLPKMRMVTFTSYPIQVLDKYLIIKCFSDQWRKTSTENQSDSKFLANFYTTCNILRAMCLGSNGVLMFILQYYKSSRNLPNIFFKESHTSYRKSMS